MRNLGPVMILMLSTSVIDVSSVAFAQAPRANDVAVGNTARKFGSSEWEWTISVMGDDAALRRISCVTYLLHATFENRSPRICQRGSIPGKGFLLTARGWGTFTVGVTIDFQDKTQRRLTHDLSFQTEVEGWGAINSPTVAIPVTASQRDDGNFVFSVNLTSDGANRKLDSIDVRVIDDGSTGNTAWAFEILLDDQPWFRIPRRSFNDRAKPVRISAASLSPIKTFNEDLRGAGASLRIVGYR
jgi:hypothetical protein